MGTVLRGGLRGSCGSLERVLRGPRGRVLRDLGEGPRGSSRRLLRDPWGASSGVLGRVFRDLQGSSGRVLRVLGVSSGVLQECPQGFWGVSTESSGYPGSGIVGEAPRGFSARVLRDPPGGSSGIPQECLQGSIRRMPAHNVARYAVELNFGLRPCFCVS